MRFHLIQTDIFHDKEPSSMSSGFRLKNIGVSHSGRQRLTADRFTGTNQLSAKPKLTDDWLALPAPYLIRDMSVSSVE